MSCVEIHISKVLDATHRFHSKARGPFTQFAFLDDQGARYNATIDGHLELLPGTYLFFAEGRQGQPANPCACLPA